MSKALYRKYRSKSLDEVIGQRHVTDILSRSIAQGRISHAYLLTGPRGVGKTSVARILAHEINKLPYNEDVTKLDIIEIDAASNNGVEDVRDLREKVQIAPVSAAKKVYIIDEVHMLSKAAFNALLKTLEEPPEHVVFILATTNAEKLPATIISRTQRFSFRPIGIDDAIKHLAYIADAENIKITDDALKLIATRSDGSFRDSISLLDQLSNMVDGGKAPITVELIEGMLGLAPTDMINQIIESVESRDIDKLIELLDRATNDGISGTLIATQLTENICLQIAEKPQLLPLLDALIDISKSPKPELKLLSVLGMAALPKQSPKSVALSAPAREVSATIAELESQAGKERGEKILEEEKLQIEEMSDKTSEQRVTPGGATPKLFSGNPEKILGVDRATGPVDKPSISKKTKTILDKQIPTEFDWTKLIEHTRQNYVALYSVLSKCGYELDGETLTLYTNSNFYKNKLSDTKYNPLLSKCLQEIGVFDLAINIIPTSKPSKDSQISAIADIMGGGEEVSLESV